MKKIFASILAVVTLSIPLTLASEVYQEHEVKKEQPDLLKKDQEETSLAPPTFDDVAKAIQDEKKAEKIAKEDRDNETLRRIEQSLNAVQSLKTQFVQRAPDGSVAEGVLYLERPGKLRFDFDDAPFLVVSNGSLLTFVDYEVKQVSRWPIKKTPLGILVDEEIKFDSSIEVPDIVRFAGLVKVPVIDPKRQEYGYIILIFEESTMELRAWEVVDAQGYTTRVALINPEYNIEIDSKNFKFKDPRPSKRGPRGR